MIHAFDYRNGIVKYDTDTMIGEWWCKDRMLCRADLFNLESCHKDNTVFLLNYRCQQFGKNTTTYIHNRRSLPVVMKILNEIYGIELNAMETFRNSLYIYGEHMSQRSCERLLTSFPCESHIVRW
jgi:hypothetical protein